MMTHETNDGESEVQRLRALLTALANASEPKDSHNATIEWWEAFIDILDEFRTADPIFFRKGGKGTEPTLDLSSHRAGGRLTVHIRAPKGTVEEITDRVVRLVK